jgi:WD40 repeat protein
MFISSVEEHPLLVYLTALPFTPINTLLYSTFMTDDIPKIVGGFSQSWSPLLHMFQVRETIVSSLAFFPDGTRIATSDDSLIRVWDVVSGSEVIAPLAGHGDTVCCLVVSPHGLRIASGSADRTVRLWDATTGAEVLPPLRGHSEMVTSVAFSPDGTRIASGSDDQTIRVWDAASGCTVFALCGHMDHVLSVVFTPDGRQIISSSTDGSISYWDAFSGSVMHIHSVEELRWPGQIVVSPDRKMIACGSYGTIHIWQPDASSRGLDIQTGLELILSLAFFPDGRHIIAISYYQIGTWDVISGTTIWVFDRQKRMCCIALSPNGEQFVIGYLDGMVALWDATSLSSDFPDQRPQNLEKLCRAISFSPDGRQIASSYSDDASIHILDAQSGVEMTTLLQGHWGRINSMAFSPCGNRIASGANDTTVRVWNLLSDAESLVLRGHETSISCMAFSHDSQQIASGSWDTTVRLWNVTSGAQIIPALRGHNNSLEAVAFSPDGTKVASGDYTCVCLWDIISGTKIFYKQVFTGGDLGMAFSPDGQHIRIQDRNTMLVWDTKNASLNPTPRYLHYMCSLNEPIIITTDGLIVAVGTRRIFGKLPSIVSMAGYTASTRSIAFTIKGRLSSIFIMHFPPSVLTSPMTWDQNVYDTHPYRSVF